MKKLYKSNKNKVLFGVIGGIAEYLNVDPTILRVAWVLLVVFTGFMPGLVAYILMALLIPKRSK